MYLIGVKTLHMQNALKKANLCLHLTSWNLPDSQLCLKSKREPSVAKAQNYIWGWGGILHRKTSTGRGETAHTFLMEATIGVGRKHKLGGGDTAVTLLMGEKLGWGHRTTFIHPPDTTILTYP